MTQDRSSSVLIVEADPALVETLVGTLKREKYPVVVVPDLGAAFRFLKTDHFAVVLIDLGSQGFEAVGKLRALPHGPEIIVMTANGSVGLAVEAMRAGAYDFVLKPISSERVMVTVRNAVERHQLRDTVETYRQTDRPGFQGFIGSSPAMQAVYRMIESAATSKATAFVTGESGTGKEVCASAIHQLSPRAKGPFVALNCAAIPKDLIESEVFGHVKGAFTGATADRDGAARQAEGGTLFLDEICEMDLNLQSKLLRFLQTGTFQRVGGSKPETVDVRIICATNRDPLEEVQAGRFREDLYYRLHVIPIILPALRERGDDILEIARHLLKTYSSEEKKNFTGFSHEAEQILRHYDWPGNVRQLQNIIRNIVVMNEGSLVQPAMISAPAGGRWARPQGFANAQNLLSTPVMSAANAHPAIRSLAEVEREAIESAIAVCNGNIPMAAAFLGVSPSTLYRKKLVWDAKSQSM